MHQKRITGIGRLTSWGHEWKQNWKQKRLEEVIHSELYWCKQTNAWRLLCLRQSRRGAGSNLSIQTEYTIWQLSKKGGSVVAIHHTSGGGCSEFTTDCIIRNTLLKSEPQVPKSIPLTYVPFNIHTDSIIQHLSDICSIIMKWCYMQAWANYVDDNNQCLHLIFSDLQTELVYVDKLASDFNQIEHNTVATSHHRLLRETKCLHVLNTAGPRGFNRELNLSRFL